MARKKRKKHSWRRTLLVFAVTPLAVWFIALLIWFFWYDITRLAGPGKDDMRPAAGSARSDEAAKSQELQPGSPSRENIPEEDRRKLDDILRRR